MRKRTWERVKEGTNIKLKIHRKKEKKIKKGNNGYSLKISTKLTQMEHI